MENWKDVPHLFANGKFDFFHFNGQTLSVKSYLNLIEWMSVNEPELVKGFKLIARPISDMSSNELKSAVKNSVGVAVNNPRLMFEDTVEYNFFDPLFGNGIGGKTRITLGTKSFIYLLSIGVYPFDQLHFETGEVISL